MAAMAADAQNVRSRLPLLRPSSLISSGSQASMEYSETDFATANDFFPVRVPLETLKVCSWRYTANELDDLELLYQVDSSELLVRSNVPGQKDDALPAVFRVRDISAADLSLVSVVPGSLESVVCRLTLETASKVVYSPTKKPSGQRQDLTEEEENEEEEEEELNCCIVTMTASVHETGHLRDILLFHRGRHSGDLFSPESLFLRPGSRPSKKRQEGATDEPVSSGDTPDTGGDTPQVSFLSGLPFWVFYIPWWLYSRNVRVLIQRAILIYTVFSVVWAGWQLYRHVNVIHVVLEPFIKMLYRHLSSVMETFDAFLALFTDWWTTFLSPLNILRAMLLTPVFQLIVPLKTLLYPLLSILAPLKAALMGLYTVAGLFGRQMWTLLSVVFKPISYLWQTLLNSRVAVASLDLQIVRLRWVSSLLVGSLKAIGNGLANFIGYTRVKQKQHKARKMDPSPAVSSPQHGYRPRTMPVYYSSPLTKQS